MAKPLEFKHYFRVIGGRFLFEDKDMLDIKRKQLEGKRGYAIIEGEIEKPTVNQYAYYFGGIIRSSCMTSQVFSGLREHEIHEILFSDLRSHTRVIEKPDGTTIVRTVMDDFSKYGKQEMSAYIDELIPYLATEYGILVKDSSYFHYNKYRVEFTKT